MNASAIRHFREADAETTARLFHESVMRATADHYSEAERRAWSPAIPEPDAWRARLRDQTVVIAECAGDLLGFMSLTEDGCLDLAYVAPAHVGRGVGGRLHDAILDDARRRGLASLRTEASLAAQGFFARHGWRVVAAQTVIRNGIALRNVRMTLDLR